MTPMIAMIIWIGLILFLGLCLFYFIGKSGIPAQFQWITRGVVLVIILLVVLGVVLGEIHLPGI